MTRKGIRLKIGAAGNTEVPAFLALKSLGFDIWRTLNGDLEHWFATNNDLELVGDSPLELLALAKLVECRGSAWQANDEEIIAFLEAYG